MSSRGFGSVAVVGLTALLAACGGRRRRWRRSAEYLVFDADPDPPLRRPPRRPPMPSRSWSTRVRRR